MSTQQTCAVQFTATRAEVRTIRAIVTRYQSLTQDRTPRLELEMDLEAVHSNGCRLRLNALLVGRGFDLMHDVAGIRACLDRDTGKLLRHFRPRYAQRQG